MINNLVTLLTVENIYLVANWGVIPFWLILIFFPQQNISKILVNSFIAPLLLALAYIYLAYKIYLDGNMFEGFQLYLGLENLYTVFSEETFLLIFWIHFLSISLFIGAWIARDSQRHSVPKILSFISFAIKPQL